MNPEDVVCRRCGLINDYRTEMKANNLTAWCNGCGGFIKNIPHDKAPKLHFGKYNGRIITTMRDEEEIKYLHWLSQQSWVNNSLKTRISSHLTSIGR